MEDHDYRELIGTYDLRTLLAAKDRLDAARFPARLAWLDAEIEKRRKGQPALRAAVPPSLDFSRDEVYAGFFWRLGALLIDLAIVFIPFSYLFAFLLNTGQLWPILFLPLLFPVYNIVSIAYRGQTPGKRVLGIVVTSSDGSPVTPSQAVRRHAPDLGFGLIMSGLLAIAILSGMSLPAGVESSTRLFHRELPLWQTLDNLWMLWIWSEPVLLALDPRRRSLHEFLSGTLVLHAAQKQRLVTEQAFEPSWYDWLEARLDAVRSH